MEGGKLTVNVNAFDDVGIDSLRLTATHGANGPEIYNMLLRQPPYQFMVDVPAYDPDVPANNTMTLHVEAIDTYGAKVGDPDKHRAEETITVQIVEDQPPVVTIGLPKDNSEVVEGDYLLVQVNGVDDLGLQRVVLNVSGLITGDRSFTDMTFPYEFLVQIPYGQANKDLTLTASATELRYQGQARTVTTVNPTRVHVTKDVDAPVIVVKSPSASDAEVVEKRVLPFSAEVTDNVRVSTVQVALFADKNLDGSFDASEEVSRRLLLSAPYSGTIALQKISDYVADAPADLTQLPLRLQIEARDGAGNKSVEQRTLTLRRNLPPQIKKIQFLDSKGYSLGDALTEMTEGRGIVVNVIAADPEVGVGLDPSLYGYGSGG